MTTQQPEAMRLADGNDECAKAWLESSDAHKFRKDTAAELRRLHTYCQELESQLAQRFDAADMATAAAQGFKDGATATAQPVAEPAKADSVLEDALSDAVRVPLDSLHADAAYLIGRLRDGSMPYVRVIEIIRERIDAAKAAIRASASHGQAPAQAAEPVAVVVPYYTPSGKRVALYSAKQDLPIGTKLYAAPQPSPTAPATQQPEGDVVAYLDVGANGYLDLGSELSEDALQQLPKGRHALVIAGTYGIDGYVAAPQPSYTAQAADSVQEDAARLDFLIDQRAYVVSDPDACPGHWLHWARPDGSTWVQGDEHPTPRAAIDAAIKQGEKQ